MSGDVPETAITAACPDCGTELNDTDKNTAGLWCPRCARYHLPPSGKRDEAGQAAYAEGVAAERERCVRVVNDFADEAERQDMHVWAAEIRKYADALDGAT